MDEASENFVPSQFLRLLLANVDIVAWRVDRDGIFTFHDGKGVLLAGLTSGAHVGKSAFELYGDGGAESPIRRALLGETIHVFHEDYGRSWETWYMPDNDERGEVGGVYGVTFDVTSVKQTERLLVQQKSEIIEQQQAVIRELSTPILQLWDGVLALPLIGLVDSTRAAEVMNNLLSEISRSRVRYALLDLTGVEIVDTGTASHLISLIEAIGLLGAEGIITGIRPAVAQTMVGLGIDMSRLRTLANLQEGLRYCMQQAHELPR